MKIDYRMHYYDVITKPRWWMAAYWGGDLNLSRSRDVIGHVTIEFLLQS